MAKIAEKSEIKLAINRYCEAKGISKNELATLLGVSSATLSNIETEKWDKIDQKMWQKIWNRVGRIEAIPIYHTRDYSAIKHMCLMARDNYFMTGLIADTGMGKTTALTTYSHRHFNTFYVSYDKTMKPKQFFSALLREMSIQYEGTLNEMISRIADELNVMDNPLVIIDEAGKITQRMFINLQVLKDKTHLSCGYVLAGMPYFKSNLIKHANKQLEGYAEFLRRINIWHELEGLSREEIKIICNNSGISSPDQQREFLSKKRFGDLANALILQKVTSEN